MNPTTDRPHVTRSTRSTSSTRFTSSPGSTLTRPPLRRWRTSSTVAVVGAAVFASAAVLGGALNPGYSHRLDAISSLAAQDAQATGVMAVGFLGLAAALLGAGTALLRTLRGKAAVAGSALVLLAGAAAVVVGAARLDCSSLASARCAAREHVGTVSTSHVVHNLVSLLLFTALVVGLFLLAAALRRQDGTRHLAVPTRCAAAAALLLMVWFGSGAYGHNGGLVQRAFLLVAVGWPVYLAVRVPRLSVVTPTVDQRSVTVAA